MTLGDAKPLVPAARVPLPACTSWSSRWHCCCLVDPSAADKAATRLWGGLPVDRSFQPWGNRKGDVAACWHISVSRRSWKDFRWYRSAVFVLTNQSKKILLGVGSAGLIAVLVGVVAGWEWALGAIVASGTGLGTWIGVRAGNKSARETDKYREEWLGKRRASGPDESQESTKE